jgi:uncharacterized protein YjbJ (UPF0337 family)
MRLEDKARNTAETVRGKAKGAVGRAKGDKELQTEGKTSRFSVI